MIEVGASDKTSAGGKKKRGMTPQMDGSGKISAGRKKNLAAAVGGTSLDGRVDCRGIERAAVAFGAELANAEGLPIRIQRGRCLVRSPRQFSGRDDVAQAEYAGQKLTKARHDKCVITLICQGSRSRGKCAVPYLVRFYASGWNLDFEIS